MVNIIISAVWILIIEMLSGFANAQVVTVEVSGLVTGATCDVNLEGSTSPLVTLPKVAASQLSMSGQTAGDKTITLEMTNCNLSGSQVVIPSFLPGGSMTETGGRLKNMAVLGAAANVELEVLYEGSPVNLAGNPGDQGAGSVIIASPNGSASVEYVVRYYATGQAEAGRVYSNMVWEVNYN